jgi:hypothetical protein
VHSQACIHTQDQQQQQSEREKKESKRAEQRSQGFSIEMAGWLERVQLNSTGKREESGDGDERTTKEAATTANIIKERLVTTNQHNQVDTLVL